MTSAAAILGAILAATAFGAAVFVSFFLAPMVFRVLEPAAASRFLRAMFPRYYACLLACGAGLVGLSLAVPGIGPASIALAALAAVSTALVPRINAARDAGEAMKRRFRQLHGLSVALNLGMLAASGWLVARLAGA